MSAQNAFRQVLLERDVAGLRVLFREHFAHLPQPKNDAQAEIMLHSARTQADWIPFPARSWSHRWLIERGLVSGLPDILRPRAERLHPRKVEMVGLFSKNHSPLGNEIRAAQRGEILELYSHSDSPDAELVRSRLKEARERTLKKLGI